MMPLLDLPNHSWLQRCTRNKQDEQQQSSDHSSRQSQPRSISRTPEPESPGSLPPARRRHLPWFTQPVKSHGPSSVLHSRSRTAIQKTPNPTHRHDSSQRTFSKRNTSLLNYLKPADTHGKETDSSQRRPVSTWDPPIIDPTRSPTDLMDSQQQKPKHNKSQRRHAGLSPWHCRPTETNHESSYCSSMAHLSVNAAQSPLVDQPSPMLMQSTPQVSQQSSNSMRSTPQVNWQHPRSSSIIAATEDSEEPGIPGLDFDAAANPRRHSARRYHNRPSSPSHWER